MTKAKTTIKKAATTSKVKPAKTAKSAKTEPPELLPTSYAEITRLFRLILGAGKGSTVITSPEGGEGSSLLAHLLAIRSAESGAKTLLVDLNMRDNFLSRSLGLSPVSWHLEDKNVAALKKLVVASKHVKNLFILPATNDEESVRHLREARNASSFMENLAKSGYDRVIVDTTPLGVLNRYNADPVILAAAADQAVLVFMACRTARSAVRNATRQLEESGANLRGVVMNDRFNPSLREELLAFVGMFRKVSPGLHEWLHSKVVNADLN